MIKTTTTISNKLGLHARASAKLTKLAGSFPCEIWLAKGERRVNAKSIMGVMMLAAGIGSTVELETNGEREQEAQDALLALIEDKFGEGERPSPSTVWQLPAVSPSGARYWWRQAGSTLRTTSSMHQRSAPKLTAFATGAMRWWMKFIACKPALCIWARKKRRTN